MKLITPKIEDIKYFFDTSIEDNESIKQNILYFLINFENKDLKIFLDDVNYGTSWKKIKNEIDEVVNNKLKNIEIENKGDKRFNQYTFQITKKVKKIIKEDYIIELYPNSKEKKSFYTDEIKLKTQTEENDEYLKLIKEIDELCNS
jgi:argonaute-like protein implicated in RNA metabolism and viral defense